MIPVYYMERHVVRYIKDESVLAEHRKGIESLCADCPIYMAIPSGTEDRFSTLIATTPNGWEEGLGTLVTLRPPP